MERKILICDCHNLEHQIMFWYDEEIAGMIIEVHLVNHKNFFKRLWFGLKYAFGYKSRYGAFDEIILGVEKQQELTKWLYNKVNIKDLNLIKSYENTTINLNRNDLSLDKRNLSFNEVGLFDFKGNVLTREQIKKASFIIYNDNDNSKYLKNIYANTK